MSILPGGRSVMVSEDTPIQSGQTPGTSYTYRLLGHHPTMGEAYTKSDVDILNGTDLPN